MESQDNKTQFINCFSSPLVQKRLRRSENEGLVRNSGDHMPRKWRESDAESLREP